MDIHEAVGAVLKVTEEELVQANEPVVAEKPEVTPELIDSLIADMPELADCDKDMLTRGITVEMEHFDAVGGDINLVARIACDHIKEFPGKDYYAALEQMEHELAETPEQEQAEHAPGGEEAAGEVPAGEEAPATETPQPSPFESKAEEKPGVEEGYNKRGKRDGTGPYKDSAQRAATGNKGKRKMAGQKCPVAEDVEEAKEPKDDELSAMKKEANKKEEDRINKAAAEKK